ncbi:hypothetical protein QFC20_000476 [Naganishia adeliensis]|uniref:Uncharacterized protein n=1 Tax=Naganishia adeliensis TaxID=92952 RepID=A0ACC2X0N3_9TREE|nr:hypothetical protein QFC20_000476 [Naganishia adeliensis]
MSKSPITCHVLDSSRGKPAQGVAVRLEELVGNEGFKPLAQGTTDSDGRCSTLLDPSKKPAAGVYKMIFETGAYFATLNQETFYPKVEVRATPLTEEVSYQASKVALTDPTDEVLSG